MGGCAGAPRVAAPLLPVRAVPDVPRFFGMPVSATAVDEIYAEVPFPGAGGGGVTIVDRRPDDGRGRPTPLHPNFTMGKGLEWIISSTKVTFIMWFIVMAFAYMALDCHPEDRESAHATSFLKLTYILAALAPIYAVLAEWNALQYCLRPFLENRGGVFLIIFRIPVTLYILIRLSLTFVGVLGLFAFGLSAIQSVEDGPCRGTHEWRFAWDATWLQSWILRPCHLSIQFWNNKFNLKHCYVMAVILVFLPFPIALLNSIPSEDVDSACRVKYGRPGEPPAGNKYFWLEPRFKTYATKGWKRFRARLKYIVEKFRLQRCCLKMKGGEMVFRCHFMKDMWDSTFFNEAAAPLASAVGFAALKDMTCGLALHELDKFLKEDINRARKLSNIQRRMILYLDRTISSIFLHTFIRAGLFLNLQVTQFMIHRAVMLRVINNVKMDWLSLVSIMVTVLTTLLFDPYQLYVTWRSWFRVWSATRTFFSRNAAADIDPDELRHLKNDRKTINYKMRTTLWAAFLSYVLFFYAVLKLKKTLFDCLGEGWNWNKCAPIPWDCLGNPTNTTMSGEEVLAGWDSCLLNATG